MNKYLAELIGTFTLVLFGCGSAVIAGADIGLTGISFAFGLALIGMAYGIGPVSGCHITPAVFVGDATLCAFLFQIAAISCMARPSETQRADPRAVANG